MVWPTRGGSDAEKLTALIKALTWRGPEAYRRSVDTIEVVRGREHLDDFMRYAELADAVEK